MGQKIEKPNGRKFEGLVCPAGQKDFCSVVPFQINDLSFHLLCVMKSRQLISSLSCSFQCPEMLMTSPCISFQSVQWGMDTQPEDPAENVRPTDTKTQQGILPALTAHLVPVWNQLDRLQSQTVVCTWIFTFAMIDWLCLSRQSCHRDTFSAHEIQTH